MVGSPLLEPLEPRARAQVRRSLALAPTVSRKAFRPLSVGWILAENQLCVGEMQRQKEPKHASGASRCGWGTSPRSAPLALGAATLALPHPPFPLFPLGSCLVWVPRAPLPGRLHAIAGRPC